MTERELFKQTFDALHASGDTVTEVMKMAKANDKITNRKKKHPVRTFVLIAAAAAALMTTALATDIFGLRAEPVGEYGMKVSAGYDDAAPAGGGTVSFTGGNAAQTRMAAITPTWLPDGMVNTVGETLKFHMEDDADVRLSISQNILNTGKATFCVFMTDVESQKSLTVNGHEAVWLHKVGGDVDWLYISYPEYNVVVDIWLRNIEEDDALRVAEGLALEESNLYFDPAYSTYLYQAAAEGRDGRADQVKETENGYVKVDSPSDESYVDEDGWTVANNGNDIYKTVLSREEMNAHAVGESFPVTFAAGGGERVALDVKVTEAAAADDCSPLSDVSGLDGDVAALLDEDGRFPVGTVTFYREGDGISDPSGIPVGTEEEQLMLVAVTMELTNNTGRDLEDICFWESLMPAEETESGYALYRSAALGGVLPDGTEYDFCTCEPYLASPYEMRYYSIRSQKDHNGSNYIDSLAAGETVTLQIGWLVTADMAPHLYLNMCDNSCWFTKKALETGYVDLALTE